MFISREILGGLMNISMINREKPDSGNKLADNYGFIYSGKLHYINNTPNK